MNDTKYGKVIDHFHTFGNYHRIKYENGYIKHYYPQNMSEILGIAAGEYLYKIDPITKKETLIEFIPENNNE